MVKPLVIVFGSNESSHDSYYDIVSKYCTLEVITTEEQSKLKSLDIDGIIINEDITLDPTSYPILQIDKGLHYDEIRHFYIQVFLYRRFKNIMYFNDVVMFHSRYKYLYMSYNQVLQKQLGQLVAYNSNVEFNLIKKKYQEIVNELFESIPKKSQYINAYQHMFGYFKNDLDHDLKELFLQQLNLYLNGDVSQIEIEDTLFELATTYDVKYLKTQYILRPFPRALLEVR